MDKIYKFKCIECGDTNEGVFRADKKYCNANCKSSYRYNTLSRKQRKVIINHNRIRVEEKRQELKQIIIEKRSDKIINDILKAHKIVEDLDLVIDMYQRIYK